MSDLKFADFIENLKTGKWKIAETKDNKIFFDDEEGHYLLNNGSNIELKTVDK